MVMVKTVDKPLVMLLSLKLNCKIGNITSILALEGLKCIFNVGEAEMRLSFWSLFAVLNSFRPTM